MRNFSNITNYFINDVPQVTLQAAITNIEQRKAFVLGFSGKKGSGKDTVSDVVQKKLTTMGVPCASTAFALGLKQEATSLVQSMYEVYQLRVSPNEMARRLAPLHDMSEHDLLALYAILKDSFRQGIIMSGWTRSAEMWSVLRMLGTDIRQPQDKFYWVRKAMHVIVENAANGITTFVTDARFVHEANPLHEIGAFLTRVDIDDQVQRTRLMSRDNVVPNITALTHRSETDLDHYEKFDIRIDNSTEGGLREKGAYIVNAWKEVSGYHETSGLLI